MCSRVHLEGGVACSVSASIGPPRSVTGPEPPASRYHRSCSRTASQLRKAAVKPSPRRAARSTAARDNPPIARGKGASGREQDPLRDAHASIAETVRGERDLLDARSAGMRTEHREPNADGWKRAGVRHPSSSRNFPSASTRRPVPCSRLAGNGGHAGGQQWPTNPHRSTAVSDGAGCSTLATPKGEDTPRLARQVT